VTNGISNRTTFRQRLHDRQHLLGTFVKTPSPHATEILGGVGFDFVVLDAEHAPLDRVTLDLMVLAARATDLAALVRVADGSASTILSALDCGAAGVLVPHVDSGERAREVVAACRYRGGRRGYSGTTRAGSYGSKGMTSFIAEADKQVACVAMIEDLAALERLEEIASVPGLDAFFVGRGDLTAAMELDSSTHPKVHEAVARIAAAARTANLPVMVLPGSKADAAAMSALGATAFVLSNDQSFLLKAAQQALTDYAEPLKA
jgi:2-keto-3-deoxy-L-rhamnonate aldolase RhmA